MQNRSDHSLVNSTSGSFFGQKLDSIQALRGIASTAVLICHTTTHAGTYGVDIFFCVSGFIMMYITANGKFSLKTFLLKRVFRIVPLYWLLTFIFLPIMAIQAMYGEKTVSKLPFTEFRLISGSLFFYPTYNPFSANENGDLGGFRPILDIAWTLRYEMIFYLIFGIACLVSIKYRSIIASVLLLLIQLVPQLAPYYDLSLFCEFILGIMAFYVIKHVHNSNKIHRYVYLAFASIFLLLLILGEYNKYWGMRGIGEGLPASLFVISFYGAIKDLKIPKSVVLLGDISFSMYLWHGIIVICGHAGLQFLYILLGLEWNEFLPKNNDILIIIEVATSFIISYFSYILIEKKFTGYLHNKFLI